jgi:hypothetical protein
LHQAAKWFVVTKSATNETSAMRTTSSFRKYLHHVAAAAALLIAAASAHAQGLVEYEFSGLVTDNTGSLGIFGQPGTVQINDLFTGRFSYMSGPSNPDQNLADLQQGVYNVIDFQINEAVVPITPLAVVVTHRPGVPQLDPMAEPDPGTDGLSIVGSIPFDNGIRPVTLKLEAAYESVFSDDSLPSSISLSDFPDLRIVQSIRVLALEPNGMSQIDEGMLTSLVPVPEPATATICLAALLLTAARPIRTRTR